MLFNKQVAVIGGDARSIYTIEQLASKGVTIFAIGFDEINFKHGSVKKCSIDEISFNTLNAIILPVHGMDETFTVEQYFPAGQIKLTREMFAHIPKNSPIFTGTAKEHLRRLCQSIQRELIVLYDLEQVAILNALPTAEAILQLAMQHTKQIIHGQTVLVTGFGRIAQATARIFQSIGATVHIVARKETDLAAAEIQGLTATHLDQINGLLPKINICINTVPHLILSEKRIKNMSQETLIIDAASKPGGTDFSAAQSYGVQAIHALGLPGKTAPITAGVIITEPITKRLLA